MVSIGAFEAKTHLSDLLVRVENGEEFVITRHGKPVARLIPEPSHRLTTTAANAIEELRSLRASHPLSVREMRELIDEGRKY